MFLKIVFLCLAVHAANGVIEIPSPIPVCASNGRDFNSFNCFRKERVRLLNVTGERIKILKLGRCVPEVVEEPSDCDCPQTGHPVCASNGRTYGNTCKYRCHRVLLEQTTGEVITIEKLGACLSNETRKAITPEHGVLAY